MGKSEKSLPVHKSNVQNTSLLFEGQKLLGGFQITETKNYKKNLNVPQVIPLNSFGKLEGTQLGAGFDNATLITDYKAYHELKQEFFLKWMIDENYHKAVVEKTYKKPNFICFGGCVTDTLMTPGISKFGNWKLYAAKFNDTIYLWDEKSSKNGTVDLQSFYGIYFEHLLTHSNHKASKINEFKKSFVINEISFGSHQLLCLNEIDAETKKKEWAEIKVYKQCSPLGMRAKFFKYWAQSIVPGVKIMVVGRHDNGNLQIVESTSTDELAEKNGLPINECYDFEDRLLTFIHNHFNENDPKLVKIFAWRVGDVDVKIEEVTNNDIPKCMLPDWYTEAVILQKAVTTETTRKRKPVVKAARMSSTEATESNKPIEKKAKMVAVRAPTADGKLVEKTESSFSLRTTRSRVNSAEKKTEIAKAQTTASGKPNEKKVRNGGALTTTSSDQQIKKKVKMGATTRPRVTEAEKITKIGKTKTIASSGSVEEKVRNGGAQIATASRVPVTRRVKSATTIASASKQQAANKKVKINATSTPRVTLAEKKTKIGKAIAGSGSVEEKVRNGGARIATASGDPVTKRVKISATTATIGKTAYKKANIGKAASTTTTMGRPSDKNAKIGTAPSSTASGRVQLRKR